MLNPYDIVGVSFWFMAMVTLLLTVFLLMERTTVAVHWRLPISIAALTTLMSFIHYYEMKSVWLAQQNVALSFRYLEWMLSFPLQLVALYFILQVGTRKDCCLFAKLLCLPVVVLTLGFAAEMNVLTGLWVYVVMALLWGYVLYILWMGRGDRAMLSMVNLAGRAAYQRLRWVVTLGWPMYAIAYYLGSTGSCDMEWINLGLNEIDVTMKALMALIIWYAAYVDSGLLSSE